jgi:hypothetical protein
MIVHSAETGYRRAVTMKLETRRPIAAVNSGEGWLVAICDDGSLWLRLPHSVEEPWRRLEPPIPGTVADRERRDGQVPGDTKDYHTIGRGREALASI